MSIWLMIHCRWILSTDPKQKNSATKATSYMTAYTGKIQSMELHQDKRKEIVVSRSLEKGEYYVIVNEYGGFINSNEIR